MSKTNLFAILTCGDLRVPLYFKNAERAWGTRICKWMSSYKPRKPRLSCEMFFNIFSEHLKTGNRASARADANGQG